MNKTPHIRWYRGCDSDYLPVWSVDCDSVRVKLKTQGLKVVCGILGTVGTLYVYLALTKTVQPLPQDLVQLVSCRPVLDITQDWRLKLMSTMQAQLMLSACRNRTQA